MENLIFNNLFREYLFENEKLSGVKKRYIERCLDNLLKNSENDMNIEEFKNFSELSEIKKEVLIENLNKLSQEWYFKDIPDNWRITYNENCQICGKPDNVYQYRIINKLNNNHLWVGSRCILKFSIEIISNNKVISNEDDKRKVFNKKKLTEPERIKSLLDQINYVNSEMKRQYTLGILTKEPKYFTVSNFSKREGKFFIDFIKRFAYWYKNLHIDDDLNGGFIPNDVIKLFKVDMKLKINQEAVKSNKFTAFHFLQFEPILKSKSIYTPKYGFTKEVAVEALRQYDKYHYISIKDRNRLVKKFSGAFEEDETKESVKVIPEIKNNLSFNNERKRNIIDF